jgi:hypothetical protein
MIMTCFLSPLVYLNFKLLLIMLSINPVVLVLLFFNPLVRLSLLVKPLVLALTLLLVRPLVLSLMLMLVKPLSYPCSCTWFECDASLVLDYDSPYVGEFSTKPPTTTIGEFPMWLFLSKATIFCSIQLKC